MMDPTETYASGQEDAITWLIPMLWNRSFTFLGNYLSYGIHTLWLLVPLILAYSVLTAIVSFSFFVNVLLYIYKKKNNIQEDLSSKSGDKARNTFTHFVTLFAKIWNGYEVIGMENVPDGPALIIYYHGPLCLDYVAFVCTLYRQTGRFCYNVFDHLLCRIPGIKLFREMAHSANFSRAECVEYLKKGELVGIPPGGLKEANFSDNNYTLVWGNRTGFAQVALEAKVRLTVRGFNPKHVYSEPIIPMFTQNIRELFRNTGNTRFTRWLYEHNRWLVLPVYGGFPVKVRTYIGEPIPYDPNITAKELAEKTKTAIENLRDQYQKIPGNIMQAFLERFNKHHKNN